MSVLFNGDWSTGSVGQYQNYQTQTSTNGSIYNSPSIDPLMTPPAPQVGPFCSFAVPDVGERNELIPALTAHEGDDWWVGWWTYLGSTVNLEPGRGFQTVGQFHQSSPDPGTGRYMASPPVATSIQSVDPPIWVVHNGETSSSGGGGGPYTQDNTFGPNVRLQRWTQMIYHIYWSYTVGTGTVDWWVDGTQYANGWKPANGTLYSDGKVSAKIGIHRAAPQPAATVLVSGFRIGTTRGDVDYPRPSLNLSIQATSPATSIQIGYQA